MQSIMYSCYFVCGAGEEPLLCKAEGRDVNSVAGVLKLYFRELREPLFPVQMFDQLIACSKYDVNGMTNCVNYYLWIRI